VTPRRNNNFMNERKVTVVRDTNLVFPELFMEVYVEGDSLEQKAFAEMFIRGRCTKADSPEGADLVVFTGGVDVDPQLYGETKHPATLFNAERDKRDMELYKYCYDNGVPMFGVCRGAQFLHVMNGGKLWQDIDNHVGDHAIYDVKAKRTLQTVSSVHHQACISNKANGMEVIAVSHIARNRWQNERIKVPGQMEDIEAFWYPDTVCFGVQGHPEYRGYYQYLQWTLEKLKELMVENPYLTLQGRCRRLRPDLIAEREKMKKDAREKELN